MFDFWKFYRGLVERTIYSDDYWRDFPEGTLLRFKDETLDLLQRNIVARDTRGLSATLAVIYYDGADKDFTHWLLLLLDQDWHTEEEDIITILEQIRDPESVDKLYEVAIDIPDYDDMRALAKKCIYALAAINTQESIERLRMLGESPDPIICESARNQMSEMADNRE